MKWRCVRPGEWSSEQPPWEWSAVQLVNPSGWSVHGSNLELPGVWFWHYEVRTLAEARKLAATIVAQVEDAETGGGS